MVKRQTPDDDDDGAAEQGESKRSKAGVAKGDDADEESEETEYDTDGSGCFVSLTGRGFASGRTKDTAVVTSWQPYAVSHIAFPERCVPCRESGTMCVAEYGRASCMSCWSRHEKCWFFRGDTREEELLEVLKSEIRSLREGFLGTRAGWDDRVEENLLRTYILGHSGTEYEEKVAWFKEHEWSELEKFVRRQVRGEEIYAHRAQKKKSRPQPPEKRQHPSVPIPKPGSVSRPRRGKSSVVVGKGKSVKVKKEKK